MRGKNYSLHSIKVKTDYNQLSCAFSRRRKPKSKPKKSIYCTNLDQAQDLFEAGSIFVTLELLMRQPVRGWQVRLPVWSLAVVNSSEVRNYVGLRMSRRL
jgi:hypothetical protein